MSWNLFGALAKVTGANFGTAQVTKGGSSTGTTTTLLAPGKQDVTVTTPPAGAPPSNSTIGNAVIGAANAEAGKPPAIPDATLAASQAAQAASVAAARARARATAGDSLLLPPSGAPTPAASTAGRSLLGY